LPLFRSRQPQKTIVPASEYSTNRDPMLFPSLFCGKLRSARRAG
jgi:hypothetical protein